MVVDAVISNWVTVVVGEEAELDVFEIVVHRLAVLFYAEYGLLASPRSSRPQEDLEFLIGLFNWVVLKTNVKKIYGDDLQVVSHGRLTTRGGI